MVAARRRRGASGWTHAPQVIYELLTGHHVDLRERVFALLSEPLFVTNPYDSFHALRENTLARLKRFSEAHFFSTIDYVRDPLKFAAAVECLAFLDYNLSIKAGVHFTLCGGTVAKLGTRKHHEEFIPRLDSCDLPGCFGMTELGHGSNVSGIETSAEYDPSTESFVINTPNDAASKFWIGGAAQHGKLCTVFAQLTTQGTAQGVHVFAVRIRDDDGRVVPGVRIEDCGHKMVLNGVDNGRIWFQNLKVPRDALLDKMAQVDRDGTYSSPIANKSTRFGVMIGGLIVGRLLIAQGAVDASKVALAIAIRYSRSRPQFGDRIVMDYVTHQRRLLVPLSNVYALGFALLDVKRMHARGDAGESRLVHERSCGLKALATWSRVETMQYCRECCGGQGYLTANQICVFKTDMDVDVTFEGDNTVLMQQTARPLITAAAKNAGSMLSPPATGHGGGCPIRRAQALMDFRTDALARQAHVEIARAGGDEAAMNQNLDIVIDVGHASMEAFALRCFTDAAASVVDAAPREPLMTALRLYAASRLERATKFYLEYGAMRASEAAQVRKDVNSLCGELVSSRQLELLVEGFGLPECAIRAPIAKDWRALGRS